MSATQALGIKRLRRLPQRAWVCGIGVLLTALYVAALLHVFIPHIHDGDRASHCALCVLIVTLAPLVAAVALSAPAAAVIRLTSPIHLVPAPAARFSAQLRAPPFAPVTA